MTRALWIIQGLLAASAPLSVRRSAKLVLPAAEMMKQMPMLSGSFLRFVGVCEVLGRIGIILPGLLRIQQWLTSLAAACLVVIMIGATVVMLAGGGVAAALFPLVVGLLCAFVAYGRWSWGWL